MNNLNNEKYFDDNDLLELLSSNKKWTWSQISRFQRKYWLSDENLVEIRTIFSWREENILKFFAVLERKYDEEILKNILENISDKKVNEIFVKLWLRKKEISEWELEKFLDFIEKPLLNSSILNFRGNISWIIK